jgi:uncharacterized SAM-binding protein YcdF (DUF218 family)
LVSRKARRRLASLAVLATAVVGLLLSDLPAHWLVLEDPPERVDAALVLAGDPYYERTGAGAALVRGGWARLLVVTGGEEGPGDSALSLREKAIALGVPPDRIRMETVSHSTREALLAAGPVLRAEQVASVALVTSPYHQRRTYLVARQALRGLRLVNRPVRGSFWDSRRWWAHRESRRVVVSEYGKLAYYALRGWL